jgi:dTDP-4-amino-4,6-dideoxygalactose transaminase
MEQAMKVPFLDLAAAEAELDGPLSAAALRVLRSGWYVGGPEVTAFEQAFAAYAGAAGVVGCANGLDGLYLGLQAAGVGAGDEVLVPSHTYIATWLAVSKLGAIPVPVEPDLATMNMDPAKVAAAMTPKTKAIVPVHLYGQLCDMVGIQAALAGRDIFVLQDAAQCHGATLHGKPVGAYGPAAWSFYPGKNLGAYGDAGAVSGDEAEWLAQVRRLGNYGSSKKYVHEEQGWNSRLDPLQAALLGVRLPSLEAWNARRSALAVRYDVALRETPLVLPGVLAGAAPVWHLYVVRTAEREGLVAHLAHAGIGTISHYPTAVHQQPAYADYASQHGRRLGPLPLAEQLAREVVSLPMGPHLTMAQQDYVIDCVRGYFGL